MKCYGQKQSSGGVLRNFAKSGKHLCQSLFLIKLQAEAFSCEFCAISKNNYSYRTPLVAASLWDWPSSCFYEVLRIVAFALQKSVFKLNLACLLINRMFLGFFHLGLYYYVENIRERRVSLNVGSP